jgi:DNA-binding NtrC family response regulator
LADPLSTRRAATILVVDDDALIAMNMVDILADLGHGAIEAYSGKDALGILEGEATVDAMITDFSMPGMNGVELARAARRLRPGLPVMVASGYADLPEGVEEDYPRLEKPFDERRLAACLAQVLGEAAVEARE